MVGYFVFVLAFIGSAQGSCDLNTTLLQCYIEHGFRNHLISLNNLIPKDTVDLMSAFVLGCSKVSNLAICLGDAVSSCSNLQDILPNRGGVNAAFYGLCAHKREIEDGLACMRLKKANLLSCTEVSGSKFVSQVDFRNIGWRYCSWKADLFDCLINKYQCGIDFKYQYKAFQLALLPAACQNFSTSRSPWLSKYKGPKLTASGHRCTMIGIKMYILGMVLVFKFF